VAVSRRAASEAPRPYELHGAEKRGRSERGDGVGIGGERGAESDDGTVRVDDAVVFDANADSAEIGGDVEVVGGEI
jgi:hypothetical protein